MSDEINYIDKIKSIAVPSRKRGSHKYNYGGSKRTAREAVREVYARNKYATRQELEKAARVEAMGAGSFQKCAEILTEGFKEVGNIMEEGAAAEVSPTTKAEEAKDNG